jgi:hypothetical protein
MYEQFGDYRTFADELMRVMPIKRVAVMHGKNIVNDLIKYDKGIEWNVNCIYSAIIKEL